MRFIVDDDIYETYEEAIKAENESKKREKEYESRRLEVLDAYKKYEILMKKFKEDYPRNFEVNWAKLIEDIFNER